MSEVHAVHRIERKLRLAQAGLAPGYESRVDVRPRFDPEQHRLELALRGRAARKVRAHLRRMESVLLRTPRWSRPGRFLEDIALDLAVGEPSVGCRTVDLGPLRGRSAPECWASLVGVVALLGRRGADRTPLPAVADRRGFRWAVGELLDDAHRRAPHPVALLVYAAESLPVDVMGDLCAAFTGYGRRQQGGPRSVLLVAATAGTVSVAVDGAVCVDLADYGEVEAIEEVEVALDATADTGTRSALRFTGGIPHLVETVATMVRGGNSVPDDPFELAVRMGPALAEVRRAIDIAMADTALARRIFDLASAGPHPFREESDTPLERAGLVRRRRQEGRLEGQAEVRAPVIAMLVS